LLVDGGVVDNLPVQSMADTQEGPVIAVEVMRRWRDEWEHRVSRAFSARKSLRSPSRVPVPSIVETIMCSVVLGSWRQADTARDRATLMIMPELQDHGLLDWKRIDEATAKGALATREALSTADPSVRAQLGI
jgi:predicted acylesterase/phospholipase RssA